jgi:L-iditol 2-dehydrogenase
MEMCIDLLSKGKLDAKSLITHWYPLEQINEAFAIASDKVKNNSVLLAILP